MNKHSKVKPLDRSTVSEIVDLENKLGKFIPPIEDRIRYVLNFIAKCFGVKLDWWDWNNGGREVDGHFESSFFKFNSISFAGRMVGKAASGMGAIIDDADGKSVEWEFAWLKIPIRYLFEDFEEDLKEGIERFKNKKEEKKKARSEKKSVKDAKRKKVLAKLTKKDKELLGLKD